MSFYTDRLLPHLINLAMRQKNLAAYRSRLVPGAEGRVLEVGIGSGLNLPFYGTAVTEIVGLDPSGPLLRMASERAARGMSLKLIEASAEAIPLDDGGFDTVVTTWSLCSIPNVLSALAEIRRVLKPSGRLLFVEHGRSPDKSVARWQDRLTPVWKPVAGGCHLNRPIEALIRQSGFKLSALRTDHMPGPKPFTYMYEGGAVRA